MVVVVVSTMVKLNEKKTAMEPEHYLSQTSILK
jgi:hypothetical protein